MQKRGIIEALFEGALWRGRLIAVLAVVFGMIGAVSLFLIASADVWQMAVITFKYFFMLLNSWLIFPESSVDFIILQLIFFYDFKFNSRK